MESVDIAQARVDMWKKRTDIYTETSFWVNELTQEITAEKPGLEHFLPPSFEMPPPPKRLPAGVSEDTSSDESDHAFRKVTAKEAIKAARAKKEAEAKQCNDEEELQEILKKIDEEFLALRNERNGEETTKETK